MRVLLVEDAPDIGDMMCRLMTKIFRIEVVLAATLAEAVAAAKQVSFDLVLVDIGLPDGSGLDFLDSAGVRVPTAILSGHTDPDMTAAAVAKGYIEYLKKPIDFSVIARCIERYRPTSESYETAPVVPDAAACKTASDILS